MPLPIAHSMMGYAIAEVAEAANVRLTNKKWYNFKIALREFLIMAPLVGIAKIFERLWKRRKQSRPLDIKNTQVARLGLLQVSPLPAELANRRSLTALAEAAEQDEHEQ